MPIDLKYLLIVLICALPLFSACSTQPQQQPAVEYGSVDLDDSIPLPIRAPVAVYIPMAHLDYWFFNKPHALVKPGSYMRRGVEAAFDAYFVSHRFVSYLEQPDFGYAVLFVLRPEWVNENDEVSLQFAYRALDSSGRELHAGRVERSLPDVYYRPSIAVYSAAMELSQQLIADTYNAVASTGDAVNAEASILRIDPELLVDDAQPVQAGTGFFVNERGDLLTAAHVVRGCMLLQVVHDEQTYEAELIANSDLLDVAVLNIGRASTDFLPLRRDVSIALGEAVIVAGFPLEGLMESSATLTLGNVSSRKALPGAPGSFQFTAPIQPGSSGSPIVSDSGELLGMATSTLNVKRLIKSGVVPQNVNFGLYAKYLKKFAEKEAIEFTYVDMASRQVNLAESNSQVIAAIAKVACYQ